MLRSLVGSEMCIRDRPNLDQLKVSPKIAEAVENAPQASPAVPAVIAGYYEPSIVFLLGTPTRLTNGDDAGNYLAANPTATAVIESREEPAFQTAIKSHQLKLTALAEISGVNYSNGRDVFLTVYAISP